MAISGISPISPILPLISQEFNVSPQEVGLLLSVFTFPGIILSPILGVLGDRIGRKRIVVVSLTVFGFAGGACFFVRSFIFLLVLRFFQGLGGASLNSITVAIISDLYDGQDRTTAIGYNATIINASSATLPTIGGGLALLGWYAPFILPVLALPLALAFYLYLTSVEPTDSALLRSYIQTVGQTLKNRRIMLVLGIGVILFVLLFGVYLNYFPFLATLRLDLSPLLVGLAMSFTSAISAITASQIGRLVSRYSEHSIIKWAFLLYATALIIIPLTTNLFLLLILLGFFGAAQGISQPCLQVLMANNTPTSCRGVMMSFTGMSFRLGQTLGPLLIGAFFGLWGLDSVFFVGGILSIITFGIIAVIKK
jgi:MFS family permease